MELLVSRTRIGGVMQVGNLVIDYCGDIGIIVRHIHKDLWRVHYIDGSGEDSVWQAQLRLLCE